MNLKNSLIVLALLLPVGAWADIPPPPPEPPLPPQPPQCHVVGYACQFDWDSGTWTIHHNDPHGPKVVIPVPKPKTHQAPNPITPWDGVLAGAVLLVLVRQSRFRLLSKHDAV